MTNVLDGVSALVLAAYLGGVIYNANVTPLLNDLVTEYGYLELLVAFFIVREVYSFAPTSDIVRLLVILGVTASAIHVATVIDNTPFTQFYQGKIGLFQLVNSILSQLAPSGSK